jgi:polyisoprenoid-binding protein YceI
MAATATRAATAAVLGPAIPTWTIDAAHSNVEFAVKHMMISTVKGSFQKVEGELRFDERNLAASAVNARIDVASITTYNEMRDNHLRTGDFFDVEQWPDITFTSTRVEPRGEDRFTVYGDLTVRGITRPVALEAELEGVVEKDPYGMRRAGFTATTEISRKEFGITWNAALETGGVAVGDTVKITLHIAAVRPA